MTPASLWENIRKKTREGRITNLQNRETKIAEQGSDEHKTVRLIWIFTTTE